MDTKRARGKEAKGMKAHRKGAKGDF